MSRFTSHSRLPALLRVFAIVALVTGSFVAVAHAGPGRGGGKGKPGPDATPTSSPTDSGHGRGHGRGGGGKGKAGKTRIKLRLTSHQFATGSDVTGTVGLQTRTGNKWGPLAGEVVVFVDRAEATRVTTSATDGKAAITVSGLADGGHQMRVHYAGDETHKPARHGQGFHVGNPPECEDEASEDSFDVGDDDDDLRSGARHGEGPEGGHGGHGRGRGKDKPKDDKPPCPEDDDSTTTDDDDAKEEDDEDGDDDDDDDDGLDTTGDDTQDTGDEDTDAETAETEDDV